MEKYNVEYRPKGFTGPVKSEVVASNNSTNAAQAIINKYGNVVIISSIKDKFNWKTINDLLGGEPHNWDEQTIKNAISGPAVIEKYNPDDDPSLKFEVNILNPELQKAKDFFFVGGLLPDNELDKRLWEAHLHWVSQFFIALPRAEKDKTQAELFAMGYVGLYKYIG